MATDNAVLKGRSRPDFQAETPCTLKFEDLFNQKNSQRNNKFPQNLLPSRALRPLLKENLTFVTSSDNILNVTSSTRGMVYKPTGQKSSILSRTDRLFFRLIFQSKFRLLAILVLIGIPIGATSSFAYRLHQQNQALKASAREVVGELEILNQEIETLSRRAGIARTKAVNLRPNFGGRGGVAIPLKPEDQLKIAKAKLPVLSRQLKLETKPALEKKLQKEVVISESTPTGNPVKTAFEVSSDFGIRPNPFSYGGYEGHDGIDLLGPHGTPIYATAAGKAERAGFDGGYGNHVLIKNAQGFETLYAHLAKLAIAPNTQVKQGQLIGYMGSTGRSTGVHLHYSIYKAGKAIDPKPFMEPNLKYSEAFNN